MFGHAWNALERERPGVLLQEHSEGRDRVQGPGQYGQFGLGKPGAFVTRHHAGVQTTITHEHVVPDEAGDGTLGGVVLAEFPQLRVVKPLVGDQGAGGGEADAGDAVLYLEGVAGEGLQVRGVSHLARALAGAARRPEVGAVGGEGAQLLRRAVEHDDRAGGEAGGGADLGEQVGVVGAFEEAEEEGWGRLDVPDGVRRHTLPDILAFLRVGIVIRRAGEEGREEEYG